VVSEDKPIVIPRFIVDDFLLGRVRVEMLERFTPNVEIVSDVWAAFAEDLRKPVRVLIQPAEGISAVDVAAVLHLCITEHRRSSKAQANELQADEAQANNKNPNVSPLENFVAVTLYWDELARVVLPLTHWWHEKKVGALNPKLNKKTAADLQRMLETEIEENLAGKEEVKTERPSSVDPRSSERVSVDSSDPDEIPDRRIKDAAPLAALIGLFLVVKKEPNTLKNLESTSQTIEGRKDGLRNWLGEQSKNGKAKDISQVAVKELAQDVLRRLFVLRDELSGASNEAAKWTRLGGKELPALIDRVFLDRKASLAATEGVCTIKADAANRLFDISCRNVTWAIIDSGIDANHPAFEDHYEMSRLAYERKMSRVRVILDFTLIEKIRNFRLVGNKDKYDGGPEREAAIEEVIKQLGELLDRAEEEDEEKFKTITREAASHRQITERAAAARLEPDRASHSTQAEGRKLGPHIWPRHSRRRNTGGRLAKGCGDTWLMSGGLLPSNLVSAAIKGGKTDPAGKGLWVETDIG
jgi:hypothetical protein